MTKEFMLDLDRLTAGEMPVTRDGRAVRIISTDGSASCPIVGFIDDDIIPTCWSMDGGYSGSGSACGEDIGHPPATVKVRTVRWMRAGLTAVHSTTHGDRISVPETGAKQYAQRDHRALDRDGGHYMRHVSAMTGEGLHAKSDIAAELAWRDWRIAGMVEQHHRDSAELRRLCAERDAATAELAALREVLDRYDDAMAGGGDD